MFSSAAQSDIDIARTRTVSDLLRLQASRTPDKTALVFADRRDSFRALDLEVNRVANALRSLGIGDGDRVAMLGRNSRFYVVLRFAIIRAGAIFTPINFMLNAAEVAYILEHSGASALIADEALLGVAAEAVNGPTTRPRLLARMNAAPGDEALDWPHAEAWSEHPDPSPPRCGRSEDDVAQIMYTSGTESRPKGAMLSTRSLMAQYVSCIIGGDMRADDVELHCLPLYHCAQLDCFLSVDLYLGATSILLPGPDPTVMLETIERERITKLFCPPTVWISLLRHPDFDRRDLSSLAKGYYGASIMPVAVIQELLQRLPDLRLWNFYGQTEMAPLATILQPHEQLARLGSAGRPAVNVETRIVDDDGHDVAPGEVGEIVHRSPQAMLGYLNDEARTAEAFAGGWFHSGDLGRLDEDGFLYVVDRKKDMIKSGGENVSSREVEEILYAHPGVAEAAVFGVPDDRWIEAVAAAVVARPGATVTEAELAEHCRERLGGYKRPKQFYIIDALPKNASGKVLKRALREMFAAA